MPANTRNTQSARRSGQQTAQTQAPRSHAQAAAFYSGSIPRVAPNGRPYSSAVPPVNSGWQQPVQPQQPAGTPRVARKPARRPAPKPPREPYRPKPWIKWVALAFVLVLIGLIVCSCVSGNRAQEQVISTNKDVTAYDDLFCQGVYVDGIHLGGMTLQEGIDAVTNNALQRLSSWEVKLTFQGQTIASLNAQTLGATINIADALNEAWAQGHTGTNEERSAAMKALSVTPFYAYTTESELDFSIVDQMLSSVEQALYVAPQDAVLLTFDANRTDPFIFQDEVVGRQLNMDSLRADVTTMLENGTSGAIELQATDLQPEVTVAYLKKYIVCERATAYTDISTSSDDNRNNNIRQAFSKINGTIIMPGQTFSFNTIVGDRTTANGFYPAKEYVYGNEQMGIGGGVCQASTTVYQAAIYAGMKITDRSPHSLVVNYSAFGKDATVNSTKGHRVDLKFVNNTDYPIYIKAGVESKENNRSRLVTRVTIYGCYKGDGVTYDFVVNEETIPAPEEAQIVVDKTGEYVTYENEEYEYQKAKDGTRVTSYHVKYVNGVEQERVQLDVDTYNPKQRILYIGATPAE